ncbi:hypothetical protein [Parathalassolituus penaei]|uniref:LapB rubredoxin metal binding domain-containing protein n=1 Tax=Parathalassolituus penaei TaxID=2997323 RepID=A0A9X3EFI2_9GAMM|nr:hypothetical protein [Parathalassolituus penaei]MCY0965815.1 hypothetical protein [Parathalassolituus penaei]
MDLLAVFLLLLVATASGWFLGYRAGKQKPASAVPDWIPSVDTLLSQHSDASLKRLINAQSMDDDTLELLLKLGRTLRDKGEVERAIHLHQGLFGRTDLSRTHAQELELELARDYLVAGLFDRAERLLQELVNNRSVVQEKAELELVELYEEEGDWQRVVDLYKDRKPASTRLCVRLAHACCELAERAARVGEYLETRRLTRVALKMDSGCARAFVVLGDMAYRQREHNEAVRCYLKAMDLDSHVVVAVLEPLVESFRALHDLSGLLVHLRQHTADLGYVPALEARVEALAYTEGQDKAFEHFLKELEAHPSYTGFVTYLGLLLRQGRLMGQSQSQQAYDILLRITENEPRFVCDHCGFKAREFHWRCPSCKDWASLKAAAPLKYQPAALEDL